MIRTILYRFDENGEWVEGVLHTFVGDKAVVETKATGELNLVPVTAKTLKFQMLTEQWVKAQLEAQRQAQAQSVVAAPGFIRR